MRTPLRTVAAAGLLSVGSCFAAGFFPLATGNVWTYRESGGGQGFTVSAGEAVVRNEREYRTLTGYTPQPVLVRADERGDLVYLDEETGNEILLISFAPSDDAWWEAPARMCKEQGMTLTKRAVHDGAAGPVGDVLEVRYQSPFCRDAGTVLEQFAENLGMLRRTVATIAGPRQYDLVYARIGKTVVNAALHGGFSVSVDQNESAESLTVVLRLQSSSGQPLKLTFPSGQEYEVLLRDPDGRAVWKWSEGRFFPQSLHDRVISGDWAASIDIPRPHAPGGSQAKPYMVEAWLTTAPSTPRFAAAVPVVLTPAAGPPAAPNLSSAPHHR